MGNNLTRVEKIVIIVTVIAVFMVFGGIGYAFFTMNDNTGSTAEITNTSGKMTITYADGGSNLLVSNNIVPSDNIIANKTFTLTGLNTTTAGDGLAMEYKVGLKYTSSFSNGQIHYYIKKVSSTLATITTTFTGEANQTVPGNETYTGYSHGILKNGNNKYTEMVNGEFPANKDEQTITFNLVLQFPDNGENQDTEKGKSINAEVIVNYDPDTMVKTLNTLYNKSSKDESGITIDGLQKDETGDFNVTLLNNSNKEYKATLLNDSKLIADTEYDKYDNLRYVGATPNNYISFNNEVWRIIGIFNVYNNDTNKNEKLVKIIRNESLGSYSWDTSESSVGINEWSVAKLMYELNCDGNNYCSTSADIMEGYLSNKTTGTTLWYNNIQNKRNASYNYSKNIKSAYIDKIANVRWNLGGTTYGQSALDTYKGERGTKHIENPTDGITRTDYWNGKIALAYASDYGYASTDTTCRNSLTSYITLSNEYNCKNGNWLSNGLSYWLLTSGTNTNSYVFASLSNGKIGDTTSFAGVNANVRPVLFLKSDTQITSGTGTESDLYIID